MFSDICIPFLSAVLGPDSICRSNYAMMNINEVYLYEAAFRKKYASNMEIITGFIVVALI